MFDIDNTLCVTYGSNYANSRPNSEIIKLVNDLYLNDYYIKIFTSRYMGRNKENVSFVKKKYYSKIKKQLISWDLKFHELILGKPSYDIHFDDKTFNSKSSNFTTRLKKFK